MYVYYLTSYQNLTCFSGPSVTAYKQRAKYTFYAATATLSFRLHLKCDGTRAETRFRLSAKRTSPFRSAGASVQLTTGSRGVRIRGSNAGYTMFRGSVKGTGYPLYSPVSPSLPLPCVTVCHHTFSWTLQKLIFTKLKYFGRYFPFCFCKPLN